MPYMYICSWLWVYLPFDVHRIHKRLGDVRWISSNVYAYVMLLLRTFCNLWLMPHICNSFLWKTHAVTSVSDSKNFIQLFCNASFPFRDHPFKTSPFFKGGGVKNSQNLQTDSSKNYRRREVGVKNREKLPTSHMDGLLSGFWIQIKRIS